MKYFIITILLSGLLSCESEIENKEKYIADGKKAALATGSELMKTLKTKISNEGIIQAIEYCNLNALPITKEMSKKYNVKIKRTAIKYRNPANEPTEVERNILEEYLENIAENEKLKPKAKLINNKVHTYFPIKVKTLCLNCHGSVGESIAARTNSKLKQLYPKDMATDFKVDDLRGMWVIEFNK